MSRTRTSAMMCNYKLALTLYKTFNYQFPIDECLLPNINKLVNSRQLMFKKPKTNNLTKVLNVLCNRFNPLNIHIP